MNPRLNPLLINPHRNPSPPPSPSGVHSSTRAPGFSKTQVFTRERLNGYYSVGSFVLSNTLASMPFILLISICSAVAVYFIAARARHSSLVFDSITVFRLGDPPAILRSCSITIVRLGDSPAILRSCSITIGRLGDSPAHAAGDSV